MKAFVYISAIIQTWALVVLIIIGANIAADIKVIRSTCAQQPRYAIPPVSGTGTMTFKLTGNVVRFDTANVNIVRR